MQAILDARQHIYSYFYLHNILLREIIARADPQQGMSMSAWGCPAQFVRQRPNYEGRRMLVATTSVGIVAERKKKAHSLASPTTETKIQLERTNVEHPTPTHHGLPIPLGISLVEHDLLELHDVQLTCAPSPGIHLWDTQRVSYVEFADQRGYTLATLWHAPAAERDGSIHKRDGDL